MQFLFYYICHYYHCYHLFTTLFIDLFTVSVVETILYCSVLYMLCLMYFWMIVFTDPLL